MYYPCKRSRIKFGALYKPLLIYLGLEASLCYLAILKRSMFGTTFPAMKKSVPLLLILCLHSAYSSADNLEELLSLGLDELLEISITGATLTEHNIRSVP